jgi:hypothetical protein
MARIFISYRREDTAAAAGRIYDRLVAHYGRNQVFMDVDSIEIGERFSDVVNRTVGTCDILLALIGDRWLTLHDARGHTRLSNPEDWVRMEIAAALRRNIRVVPVLVNGASVPGRSELPSDLGDLALRHACEVTHGRFHSDVDRLLTSLDRALGRRRLGLGRSRNPRTLLWFAACVAATIGGGALTDPMAEWLRPNGSEAMRLMLTVGVLFGPVVLGWHIRAGSKPLTGRNAAFLAASVATAVAALYTDVGIHNLFPQWAKELSPILMVPIFGAVYLALGHRFVLRCSWIQAAAACVCAVLLYSALLIMPGMLTPARFLSPLTLTWQIGYLLGMYAIGAVVTTRLGLSRANNNP